MIWIKDRTVGETRRIGMIVISLIWVWMETVMRCLIPILVVIHHLPMNVYAIWEMGIVSIGGIIFFMMIFMNGLVTIHIFYLFSCLFFPPCAVLIKVVLLFLMRERQFWIFQCACCQNSRINSEILPPSNLRLWTLWFCFALSCWPKRDQLPTATQHRIFRKIEVRQKNRKMKN